MAPSNHLFVWGVSVMCIMVLISTYVNQKGVGDIRNEMINMANSVTKTMETLKSPDAQENKEVSCVGAATSRDIEKLQSKIEEMKTELSTVNAKLKTLETSCKSAEQSIKEVSRTRPEQEEPKKEILDPKKETSEPKKENPNPREEEPTSDGSIVKGKKKMIVGILASYTRAERRQAVRETWLQITKGTPRENEWTYKFFLANPDNKTLWDAAHEENKQHNDIVFFDHFLDTYRNLSRKTLAISKWATDHYDFEFLFKTDDDAFVRLDRLLERLDGAPKEKYFAGISNGHFRPERDKGSIWYVSEEDWPDNKPGPNVITGAGYVVSYDCAAFMAKKAADPKTKYLPLEDVNTAVVLSEFGVEGGQIHGFLKGVCPCTNEMILTHWCSPQQLRGFYSVMQRTSGNNMC